MAETALPVLVLILCLAGLPYTSPLLGTVILLLHSLCFSPPPRLSVHLHSASWFVQIQPQKAVLKLGVSFELCNKPVIPRMSELVVFPLQQEGFL